MLWSLVAVWALGNTIKKISGYQLSAHDGRLVGHGHLVVGRLGTLLLARIPEEHNTAQDIVHEREPGQINAVAITENGNKNL